MSEKIHCDNCDKVVGLLQVESLKLHIGGDTGDILKQYCHDCMVNIVHKNPWFKEFFSVSYW